MYEHTSKDIRGSVPFALGHLVGSDRTLSSSSLTMDTRLGFGNFCNLWNIYLAKYCVYDPNATLESINYRGTVLTLSGCCLIVMLVT